MKAADLGAILFEHPDVSEVYVTSYSEGVEKAVTVAFVVPIETTSVSAEKLKRYCSKHKHKNGDLVEIILLDEMPRNRAGTVNRDRLRRLASSINVA